MIDAKHPISLHWSDEDNCWIATVPYLAPCSAHGATAVDACANVQDAIRGKLEVSRDRGFPLS